MSQPLGDPGRCRRHAFYAFLRVDLQISPIKLLLKNLGRCVLQCFVEVETKFFRHVSANSAAAFMFHLRFTVVPFDFLRDVSANSAAAFMVQLRFTVLRRFAVRQFCELDTSTYASTAFWLSCSFVTCDSHVVGEGRWSNPGGILKVNVSQD